MKLHLILPVLLCAVLGTVLPATASVPLRWQVETSRLQPVVFDAVRGETLALEASFNSYGMPLSMAGKDVALFYQTNGMGSAWWTAPATVSTAALRGDAAPGVVTATNVISSTFTPAMDPGASTLTGFLGSTGDIYRAAFTIRFRNGPGAKPNVIEQPPRILDLANTVIINPPWPTQADFADTTTVMRTELKDYVDGQISGAGLVSPSMTTNIASATASNVVTRAYVESLGISAGISSTIVTNIASSATSNVVTKAYVESLGVSTSGSQTNSLIASGPLEIHADLTAKVATGGYTDSWEPSHSPIPDNPQDGDYYYSGVWYDVYRIGENVWYTQPFRWNADQGSWQGESGEIFDSTSGPNATTLTFPDGTVTHRVPVTRTTRLATTNDLATSSAETLASATALIPTNAAQVGAYPASSGSQLATQVSTIGAHLNAEDARVIVTNYNSATHMPEASVEIKLPDTTWSTVWREMTRWNYLFDTYLPTNYASKVELDEKADRAWGYYDSHTGLYTPDGFTWISSPKIAIAANLAYQRTVTSEGSVWVLESSGLVTETGVLTNGFFRITDDEGNAQFEIVKGNKRTIGADANSVQTLSGFSPTKLQIGYSVQSDAHPTILVTTSLVDPSWKEETAADCPATVSWSGSSGEWVAQVQAKTALAQMFVQATYQFDGETYIRNAAPVSMSNIIINGTNFVIGTATVGGHTVLTLTPAP